MCEKLWTQPTLRTEWSAPAAFQALVGGVTSGGLIRAGNRFAPQCDLIGLGELGNRVTDQFWSVTHVLQCPDLSEFVVLGPAQIVELVPFALIGVVQRRAYAGHLWRL